MTATGLQFDREPDENERYAIAVLRRLQREVRAIGQQLDRVEADMWRALTGLAFEGETEDE